MPDLRDKLKWTAKDGRVFVQNDPPDIRVFATEDDYNRAVGVAPVQTSPAAPLQQPRQPDIRDSIRAIYGDQDPQQVIDFIKREPQIFQQQLRERGRTPETKALLKGLGVNDTQAEFIQMGEGEQDVFLNELFQQGRNTHTERIIKEIKPSATDDDIEQFYNVKRIAGANRTPEYPGESTLGAEGAVGGQIAPEYPGEQTLAVDEAQASKMSPDEWLAFKKQQRDAANQATRPKINPGDAANAFILSSVQNIHKTKQAVTTLAPQYLADLLPYLEGAASTGKTSPELEKIKVDAQKTYIVNEEQHQEWLKDNPNLAPKAEYETFTPKLLSDPNYLMYTIAKNLPASLTALVTGAGVTAATGNPLLGAAAGAGTFFPMQSQDVYDDLIANGAPMDSAGTRWLAAAVGGAITSLEMASDIPLLTALKPVLAGFRKTIVKEAADVTVKALIKKGITNFASVEAAETATEVMQQAIQNATVKYFNENRDVFEGMGETAIQTLIATAPLALLGAGSTFVHVNNAKALATGNKSGWTRDETTGEWYQPKRLTDLMREKYREFKAAGLSADEAKLKALNFIAMTKEGAAKIGEFARELATSEVGAMNLSKRTGAIGRSLIKQADNAKEAVPKGYRRFGLKDNFYFVPESMADEKATELITAQPIRRAKATGKGKPISQEEADYAVVRAYNIAEEANAATGDAKEVVSDLQQALEQAGTEAQARSAPYHAGMKNTLPDLNNKQLDIYLNELEDLIKAWTPEGESIESTSLAERFIAAESGNEMSPSTSVQTGLKGFGKETAQGEMLGESNTAVGQGGSKPGLMDVEALKSREAGKPLSGQAPLGVQKPVMITRKMEADLKAKGYTQAQINKMTPDEAWGNLGGIPASPEAPLQAAKPAAKAEMPPTKPIEQYYELLEGAEVKAVINGRLKGVVNPEKGIPSESVKALINAGMKEITVRPYKATVEQINKARQILKDNKWKQTSIDKNIWIKSDESPLISQETVKPEAPQPKAEVTQPTTKAEAPEQVPVMTKEETVATAGKLAKDLSITGEIKVELVDPSELYTTTDYGQWKEVSPGKYEIKLSNKRSDIATMDTLIHELTHIRRTQQGKAKQINYHSSDFYRDWDKNRELLKQKITPIEELVSEVPATPQQPATPPQEPPKPPKETATATPEPEPPAIPTPMQKIIDQSQEVVKQDRPGLVTQLIQRIPGLKQVAEFERPGLKMTGENEKVLVSWVAGNAAKADVLAREMPSRQPLLKQMRQVFGKKAMHGAVTDIEFTGTPEQRTSITGTLLSIFQRPILYNLTAEQKAVIKQWGEHTDSGLKYVTEGYGAEIGKFKPSDPEGVYVPNVDVGEDVVQYMSESRAVTSGRSKTRFYDTAEDRLAGKVKFTPELDMEKLLGGIDSFQASAAGSKTLREVLGGKTKLEVLQETHPELYAKMTGLRNKLQKLKGYQNILKEETFSAIDDFLSSPVEDIDVANMLTELDVKLEAGRYVAKAQAGKTLEDIQNEIDNVKAELKALRPAWQAANPKPYVFVQEGLFRYYPADQAVLIKELLKTTNNPILNAMELVRGTAFSGDLSPLVGVQTPLGALFDPLGAVRSAYGATKKVIQERDLLRSYRTDALAEDMKANPEIWAEYFSLMGRAPSGTPSEFAGGLLHLIPGFKGFNEGTFIAVTRQSKLMWERISNDLIKSGMGELEAKVAAASVTAEAYPLMSSQRLGQSQARQAVLRALPTSYSFIRQPAVMMQEAAKGFAKIATRQELSTKERLSVRMTLTLAGSVMAASVISQVLNAVARDEDPVKAALDAINPDPMNGKFASLVFGNLRIPIGGPYRAIFRAIYPQQVDGIPVPVPFYGLLHYNIQKDQPEGYLWNRINPLMKAQIDIFFINKDYYGNKILKGDFIEQFARGLEYELESTAPLTIGTVAEGFRIGESGKQIIQNVIGQFAGTTVLEMNKPAARADKLIDELGKPVQDDKYNMTFSIKPTKINDMGGLFSDIKAKFKYVKPEDVTVKNGYDPIAIDFVKAQKLKEDVDTIPDRRLVDYNTDPTKGDTIESYNFMWQARSKLTDPAAIAEFDKKYGQDKAYLGNLSRRQISLMEVYGTLTKAQQKQFVIDHPELNENPRETWLIDNPESNARLAIWGQEKILTKEAYDLAVKMVKDLDIPDKAVDAYLPPKDIVENYFKLQDVKAGTEFKSTSWEEDLLLAKDNKLREWLGYKPVDTPLPALELKVANHANMDKYESYGDMESPDFIADEKARAKARKQLKAGDFGKDLARIEVFEKGGNKELSEDWVKFNSVQDQYGSSSAEAKLWLIDNSKTHDWAIQNGLLTASLDKWNEKVLRIDAKYRNQDAAYAKFSNVKAPDYIRDDKQRELARQQYLEKNPAYRDARTQRQAYTLDMPDNLVSGFVEYSNLPEGSVKAKLYRLDHPELSKWGESDKTLNWKPIEDNKENLRLSAYWYDMDKQYDEYNDTRSPLYIENERTRAETRKVWLDKNPLYRDDRLRRDARNQKYPEQLISDYVGLQNLPEKGYDRERYLAEHQELYEVWRKKVPAGQKAREIDFVKIPTPEIEALDNQYDSLPHVTTAREAFRRQHRDFDYWGVLSGKFSKPTEAAKGGSEDIEKLYVEWKTAKTKAEADSILRDNPILQRWLNYEKAGEKAKLEGMRAETKENIEANKKALEALLARSKR